MLSDERPTRGVQRPDGSIELTPLTDEEWAEHRRREEAAIVARQAEKDRVARRLDVIRARAAEDPAFAALCAHLGLITD